MKLTTSDAKDMGYISACLVGESGAGKTTSILTLPPESTVIGACDVRRSMLPLRHRTYPVIEFSDGWPDANALIRRFQKPVEIDGHKRTVLVIDSLTGLAEMCKLQIVNVDRRLVYRERPKQGDKPIGVYDEQMTIEDWGVYGLRMRQFISAACRLPCHVIMTCLSEEKENRVTGERKTVPALNGKLAYELGAYFDLVLYMRGGPNGDEWNARLWQTFNDGRTIAKDSTGILDPCELPDWSALFTKVLGKN